MKKNPKTEGAFFFDLDDTLYDQLQPFKDAVMLTYECKEKFPFETTFKKSREYSDALWRDYTIGKISLNDLRVERLVRAFQYSGFHLSSDEARKIQEVYEKKQASIQLFDGVLPFFEELRKRNYVIGIITNGPVKHQMKKITSLYLTEQISSEYIFVSDAVEIAKPDPNIFKYVSEKVGLLPKDCYYIGDSWNNDVVSPMKAGWKAIWFNYRNREPDTVDRPYKIISDYNLSIIKEINN